MHALYPGHGNHLCSLWHSYLWGEILIQTKAIFTEAVVFLLWGVQLFLYRILIGYNIQRGLEL